MMMPHLLVVSKHSLTLKQYNYESIVKYFNAEKAESLLFMGFSVFAIILSVYFFFYKGKF
jgi:hypothetical protein